MVLAKIKNLGNGGEKKGTRLEGRLTRFQNHTKKSSQNKLNSERIKQLNHKIKLFKVFRYK